MAFLKNLIASLPLMLILLSTTSAERRAEVSPRRHSSEDLDHVDGVFPDTFGQIQQEGCIVGQWSEWGNCSTRCNKGIQTRTRETRGNRCLRVDPAQTRVCNEETPCKPCMICKGVFTRDQGPRTYRIQTNEPAAADILLAVDESNSMVGEHAWLDRMVADLDRDLKSRGIGNHTSKKNYFGLVGFGSLKRGRPNTFNVSGATLFSSEEFPVARKQLLTDGAREDGYLAIYFTYNRDYEHIDPEYQINRPRHNDKTVGLNVILVTDEARTNNVDPPEDLTKKIIKEDLLENKVILNVIVNQTFTLIIDGKEQRAIGADFRNRSYFADNKGNFIQRGKPKPGFGDRSTYDDYTELALDPDVKGASWDINLLRQNNTLLTDSFTRAFTSVKAREILSQVSQCEVCTCDGVDGQMKCIRMDDQITCCHKAGGKYDYLDNYCVPQEIL